MPGVKLQRANRIPEVAVIDDTESFAQERADALIQAGIVAEVVTNVDRFRALAEHWESCLFFMDFDYLAGPKNGPYYRFDNAAGLLAATEDAHHGRARVVLISRVISNPDVLAVQDKAQLIGQLRPDEWDAARKKWIERIRLLVRLGPHAVAGNLRHLHPDASADVRDKLLLPFAHARLASNSKAEAYQTLVLCILARLERNDPQATCDGIATCLKDVLGTAVESVNVPVDHIIPDDGANKMVQTLEDVLGYRRRSGHNGSSSSGAASGVRVLYMPGLERVVELRRHSFPTVGEDQCATDLGKLVCEIQTVKGIVPSIALVPVSDPTLVRDSLRRVGVVLDLRLPTAQQLAGKIRRLPLQHLLEVRTGTIEKGEAVKRLAALCVESQLGYEAIDQLEVGTDGVGWFPTLRSLIAWIRTLAAPENRQTASEVRERPRTQEAPARGMIVRTQVDSWKEKLRSFAARAVNTERWTTRAELERALSIPSAKQRTRRKGGPRPEPVLMPAPAKQPQWRFIPKSDGAVAWIEVLHEESGIDPRRPKYTAIARRLVHALNGAGQNDEALVRRVAGRLRDFHQGTVPQRQ